MNKVPFFKSEFEVVGGLVQKILETFVEDFKEN